MASKYDQYWVNHLNQVHAGVSRASSQGVATIPLSGLRALGDRRSWYGTAEVRGLDVVTSSMAHATSLAKMMAGSGICGQWPGQTIRFTINTAGDSLSIAAVVTEPGTSPERPDSKAEQARVHLPAESPGRVTDTGQFYTTLTDLARKVGGPRLLRTCTGSSGWPRQGVYFFYEGGELRPDNSGRIVRVGTHALTVDSQATLWGRLRQHRGSRDGNGNRRASVFRRHVGAALIRREKLPQDLLDSWLSRNSPEPQLADQKEQVEHEVSRHIGAMPFLWLAVPEAVDRGYIERHSIALLSSRQGGQDPPSRTWLGNYAHRVKIRESGLWNVDHVDLQYDPAFLDRLEHLAHAP
jgi:hypothetical protein